MNVLKDKEELQGKLFRCDFSSTVYYLNKITSYFYFKYLLDGIAIEEFIKQLNDIKNTLYAIGYEDMMVTREDDDLNGGAYLLIEAVKTANDEEQAFINNKTEQANANRKKYIAETMIKHTKEYINELGGNINELHELQRACVEDAIKND
ncbi:MAG: hypothetical protein BWY74_02750 [Firmicutes bacterium ADurb.Bin419]|nr:MAG: hypothetical protein BWY74_02750 [Firmicutes bacterium ADurb.Bin419]